MLPQSEADRGLMSPTYGVKLFQSKAKKISLGGAWVGREAFELFSLVEH